MRHTYLFILAIVLLSCSCEKGRKPLRSVYYWSTAFNIDSAQSNFISEQDIQKIYLRYFDVVVTLDGEVMPNATVQFGKQLLKLSEGKNSNSRPSSFGRTNAGLEPEIIPTIYIVNNCLTKNVSNLDSLILQRILQMNETNDITNVREIQIDCDWTRKTRKTYFEFLTRLRQRAREKGLGISATIRLHQLAEAPPPVDRGILMMYNTGDVTRLDVENPILDVADAYPYLRHLDSYKLPLATAYPVYAWRVVFRHGKFVGILHYDGELPLLESDSIVTRQPSLEMVMKAKEMVDKHLPHANDEIILFDISNKNVQRINKFHYEKVFNH